MYLSEKIKKAWSGEYGGLALLSFVAIVEAIQILIAVIFIYKFIPLQVDINAIAPVAHQYLFRPERELFFYRIFVMSVIFLQICVIAIFRNKIADKNFIEKLKRFAISEILILSAIIFSLFKMAVYGPSKTLYLIFYTAGILAIMIKLFWPILDCTIQKFNSLFTRITDSVMTARIFDIFIPLAIILIIYIPDRAGFIAKAFVDDGFLHIDTFVMSSSWSFVKGCILNIDVYAAYGMGMPILVGYISKLLGGFSYENVLLTLTVLGIIYYICCYAFLRVWLKNTCLAVCAILIILKLQMFNRSPFIWQVPNCTVVRHFFDIIFFFCIFAHIKHRRVRFLSLAALLSGLALFYVTDTGIYLLIAFYAYLIALIILPYCRQKTSNTRKDIMFIAVHFLVPLFMTFLLLLLFIKGQLFTKIFWVNNFETARMFISGFGATPIHESLIKKDFGYFILGCGIVITYIFTMVFLSTMMFFKKIKRENILVIILCIYGLGMYHYYICRSSVVNHLAVCAPFIFIVCYWIQSALKDVNVQTKRVVLAGMLIFSVFSLATTDAFINYPNMLNFSKFSFNTYKEKMEENFISEKDVEMIRKFTQADEKVCLISSYEIATLMAADRRPFFYYLRLVSSRFMKMLDFGGFDLFTRDRVEKTFNQIEQERPEYAFMESKLLLGKIPNVYYNRYPELTRLIKYLRKNYYPVESGYYLVALKRRSNDF